jgi:hypothetical protein
MEERRRHKRFKHKLLITVVSRDENDNIFAESEIYSEDVSLGGLRLAVPRQQVKGGIIDMKIFLFPDTIHLPASGKVVWSDRKQGLEVKIDEQNHDNSDDIFWSGIQFVNIDEFTRERIIRWIKKEFNVSYDET